LEFEECAANSVMSRRAGIISFPPAHVCAAIKSCEYKQQQTEQIVFWGNMGAEKVAPWCEIYPYTRRLRSQRRLFNPRTSLLALDMYKCGADFVCCARGCSPYFCLTSTFRPFEYETSAPQTLSTNTDAKTI
jgi:hypothetical protein